jgi:hypothetical protein
MQTGLDHRSTSIDSYIINKKKKTPKNKKKFFEMRNVIKKVKTHGLKCFSKCLLSLTKSKNEIKSKWKVAYKKQTYKLFKSDICKLRNRLILNLPMKDIMRVFSNMDINIPFEFIREGMNHVFKFLINITWDQLLNYLKNDNSEISILLGKSDSTLRLTKSHVRKYYEYINHGVDYKKRSKMDDDYVNLYETLKENLRFIDQKSHIDIYLNGFSQL